MSKDVLIVLTGSPSDSSALETGFLSALRHGGHMDCVHVRPGPAEIIAKAAVDQFSATMGNVALIDAIERAAAEARKSARKSFEAFCGQKNLAPGKAGFHGDGISTVFHELVGDATEKTVEESRFHDLTVLARGDGKIGFTLQDIGNILVRSGRPLLLAPPRAGETVASRIAIAWKETPEATRAVGAALPILRKAERVFVLVGDESGEGVGEGMNSASRLVEYLKRHNISAEAKSALPIGRSVQDAILAAAAELGIDLLVSGAYGHSRAREMVFGGFTRHVIREAKIPVFLFH